MKTSSFLSAKKLTIRLASEKVVVTCLDVGTLKFLLETYPTKVYVDIMRLGVYDGILGMDWLKAYHANLCCHSRILSLGNQVQVDGKPGKPKAILVKKK